MVVFGCLVLGFTACEKEDLVYGEEAFVYMPQATFSGGTNNIYNVPMGGGEYTYNLKVDSGKVKIMLGVIRSGSFEGEEFSVNVMADPSAANDFIASGSLNNGAVLPDEKYSLPSKVTVVGNKATFYLSVDSATIINDPAFAGQQLALAVRIDNPTKYNLGDNSATMVVIDVESIRELFFQPKEGFLYRKGTKLMLNGTEYRSVGLYAPTLDGCAATEDGVFSENEIDSLFSILPENSLVRTRAFKNNLDRTEMIIKLAEKHNIKLSLSLLEGDNRGCGAYWVGNSWYDGGYKEGDFLEYVEYMGSTYKDSPAIGMWEIADRPGEYMNLNEDILKPFLKDVAEVLKNADLNHLVSSGLDSEYAYGPNVTEAHYRNMHNNVYLDIGTLRDIDWNIVASWHYPFTYNAMNNLNKSFIIIETVLRGGTGADCNYNLTSRASHFLEKANYYLDNGTSVVFSPPLSRVVGGECDPGFDLNDPLLKTILDHPLNQNLGK